MAEFNDISTMAVVIEYTHTHRTLTRVKVFYFSRNILLSLVSKRDV